MQHPSQDSLFPHTQRSNPTRGVDFVPIMARRYLQDLVSQGWGYYHIGDLSMSAVVSSASRPSGIKYSNPMCLLVSHTTWRASESLTHLTGRLA